MKTYTILVKKQLNKKKVKFVNSLLEFTKIPVYINSWWEDSLTHGVWGKCWRYIEEPVRLKFVDVDTNTVISVGELYPKKYNLLEFGEPIFTTYNLEDAKNLQEVVYPYSYLEVVPGTWGEVEYIENTALTPKQLLLFISLVSLIFLIIVSMMIGLVLLIFS